MKKKSRNKHLLKKRKQKAKERETIIINNTKEKNSYDN